MNGIQVIQFGLASTMLTIRTGKKDTLSIQLVGSRNSSRNRHEIINYVLILDRLILIKNKHIYFWDIFKFSIRCMGALE